MRVVVSDNICFVPAHLDCPGRNPLFNISYLLCLLQISRTCPVRLGYYLKYFIFLDCFCMICKIIYNCTHAHIQENSGFALKYAVKYGIVNILCTSHFAGIKYIFCKYASLYLNKYVTKRLSCDVEARKAIYRREPFTVIPFQ